MKQVVICVVPTEPEAGRIVAWLRKVGFCRSDISVLMPDPTGVHAMVLKQHSKTTEETPRGVSAFLDDALRWLTDIGVLAITGIGPIIATGPLLAVLCGATLEMAAGSISDGLISLGIPEYEAKQYESDLGEGNILVSVHIVTVAEAKRAEEVFKSIGAKRIKRTDEEIVKASNRA
jgi:hypothetical protein